MGQAAQAKNKKANAQKPAPASRPSVDTAQQKVAEAKKDLESKQSLLAAAAEKVASGYHSRPEYVKGKETLTAAQAKLAAASKAALEDLKQKNPAYTEALAAREKAVAKRNEVVNQQGSTTEERLDASTQVLRTGEAVAAIESVAMAGSTDVVAAKKEVADAAAALAAMDHTIDDTIKQDPGVQSARTAFDQAKTAESNAEQALKQTQSEAAAWDAQQAEARRKEEGDRRAAAAQKNTMTPRLRTRY
jgi:chromosome segregation protein